MREEGKEELLITEHLLCARYVVDVLQKLFNPHDNFFEVDITPISEVRKPKLRKFK